MAETPQAHHDCTPCLLASYRWFGRERSWDRASHEKRFVTKAVKTSVLIAVIAVLLVWGMIFTVWILIVGASANVLRPLRVGLFVGGVL